MITPEVYDDITVPADHSDIIPEPAAKSDAPSTGKYRITVTNPQKVGEKNPYVVYEVKAQVEGGDSLVSVRRYSDFLWLHDRLQSRNRCIVIPPIPEKSFFGNFTPELLLFRGRELTRFLMRVAIHPKLSQDEDFVFFLRATKDQMAQRRGTADYQGEEGKTSWFSSFLKRANEAKLAMMGSDQDDNPYFKDVEELLKTKNALLNQMLANSSSLVARWQRISLHFHHQAALIRSLAGMIKEDADKCSIMFSDDASACEQCEKLTSEFATKLEYSHHDTIRDYLRENDAIQVVIDERTRMLRNYNALSAQVAKGSIPVEEKDKALAELDAFSKFAQEDIERVLNLRCYAIDTLAEAIARSHRSFYKQMTEVWAVTSSTVREYDQ